MILGDAVAAVTVELSEFGAVPESASLKGLIGKALKDFCWQSMCCYSADLIFSNGGAPGPFAYNGPFFTYPLADPLTDAAVYLVDPRRVVIGSKTLRSMTETQLEAEFGEWRDTDRYPRTDTPKAFVKMAMDAMDFYPLLDNNHTITGRIEGYFAPAHIVQSSGDSIPLLLPYSAEDPFIKFATAKALRPGAQGDQLKHYDRLLSESRADMLDLRKRAEGYPEAGTRVMPDTVTTFGRR